LKWLEIRPHVQVDKESSLPKIQWDNSNDDEMTERYIIRLAKLLAHLRGVAVTWKTEDTQGSDYGYTRPIIEDPSRAVTQLKNLARGHALLQGRNYLTRDDIPIVIKTVLSTASVERVFVFDKLLINDGKLTTTQITGALNISSPTARRTMTELSILELVNMTEIDEKEKKIKLKPEFEWFLSEEFKKLREEFVPTDNTEDMKKEGKKEDL
jgi:predicted transcriptional regulator